MLPDKQADGRRLLLCSVLGCWGLTPTLGWQTEARFEISKELRQRRTTAGAACVWRSEVLMAGLGPAAPALESDPRDLAAASEEEGSGWQEVAEGGDESEGPWCSEGPTLRRLVDPPRHFGSFSSSSLVSTTMSRQLPTLRGRRGRGLFTADSPSAEPTDSLFGFGPPAVLWSADLGKESEPAQLPSPLLEPHDARLSEDRKRFCRLRWEESSRMVSKEQLLVWYLRAPAVLRLVQLPPKRPTPAPAPPLSAADRDWSVPLSTSLMGDSASSHPPCLSSDKRRHSVDWNGALAGGGADGSSAFLRLARWCTVDVVTHPQNTESKAETKKKCQSVQAKSVQADS